MISLHYHIPLTDFSSSITFLSSDLEIVILRKNDDIFTKNEYLFHGQPKKNPHAPRLIFFIGRTTRCQAMEVLTVWTRGYSKFRVIIIKKKPI
jgi:hypothetical protein